MIEESQAGTQRRLLEAKLRGLLARVTASSDKLEGWGLAESLFDLEVAISAIKRVVARVEALPANWEPPTRRRRRSLADVPPGSTVRIHDKYQVDCHELFDDVTQMGRLVLTEWQGLFGVAVQQRSNMVAVRPSGVDTVGQVLVLPRSYLEVVCEVGAWNKSQTE